MTKKIIIGAVLFFLVAVTLGFFLWKQQNNILGAQIISPNTAIDPTLALISALAKTGIVLETPPILSGGTITASISGSLVLFSKDDNIDIQVRALQLVLPRLRIDNKTFHEIDLRFNKVIVR